MRVRPRLAARRPENELLLPALAEDPNTDLPTLLPVMDDRFTAYRAAAST